MHSERSGGGQTNPQLPIPDHPRDDRRSDDHIAIDHFNSFHSDLEEGHCGFFRLFLEKKNSKSFVECGPFYPRL